MAHLEHLGGDKWRVRVPISRDPGTGRRRVVNKSFTASGPQAARRKMHKLVADIEARHDGRRDGTVGQLLDDWLASRTPDLSPTTLPGYRRRVARINARFGTVKAADLTGRDIDRWYTALRDDHSPAEIQHIHRVFRAALRWGRWRGDVPTVETERTKPPTHRPPEVRPPTPDALRLLLEALPADAEWARAVRLAAFTGMRRGEIVGLRWDRLSAAGVSVAYSVAEVKGGRVVKSTKGKRSRDVAVDELVFAELEAQRAHLERIGINSPWVFPDWRTDLTGKTPRRPGWLSLMWSRHRKDYGGESVRLHDLRHAYATRAIDAGAPITAVAAQLGHAQTSTTSNIYGHGTDPGRAAVAAAGVLGLTRRELPAPR